MRTDFTSAPYMTFSQHEPDDLAELFLDRARSSFHRGELAEATCSHLERNPTCGDEVRMQLRVDPETVSAWFLGRGCLVSQASASLLCETIDGRSLAFAQSLTAAEVLRGIGIPLSPLRQNCALLSFRALQRALAIHSGASH